MGADFVWVAAGTFTISNDIALREMGDDPVEQGEIGLSLTTGDNVVEIYGQRDAHIAMLEDALTRLKAGEGASGWGEEREFVFADKLAYARDVDGDDYEAGQLDEEFQLRDNSIEAAVEGSGLELTGDTWQVMGPGEIRRDANGQVEFVVKTRKVLS
jgi:hypothetical protein